MRSAYIKGTFRIVNLSVWHVGCLFFLVTLFANITGAYAQGVSVSPSRIFFNGDLGQEISRQITLTNTGIRPVIFKASIVDWSRDSVGEKHYYPAGSQRHSNANWLQVTPAVVQLAPGAHQQVTVTMRVPAKLPDNSVTNSMIFLTQLNEQQSKSEAGSRSPKIGVIIKLEFGVHVYYTPPVTVHKDLDFLAFTNNGLKYNGKEKVHQIAIKVKNVGNAVTDGFIRFEITNKASGEELKIPVKAISLMPGDEQTVYVDLPENLKGEYLLVALMDGGEETNLKVAKKTISFGN